MFIILVILALCKVSNGASENLSIAFVLISLVAAFVLWIYLCTLSAKLIGVYMRGQALSIILDKDRLVGFLRRIFRRKKMQIMRQAAAQKAEPDAAAVTTPEPEAQSYLCQWPACH